MKINKKQFSKWVAALRSGKYKQAKFLLQNENGFCCLGVACKVLSPNYLKINGMLIGEIPIKENGAPPWILDLLEDFQLKTSINLPYLNDARDFTFDEIADVLEAVYIHKVLN